MKKFAIILGLVPLNLYASGWSGVGEITMLQQRECSGDKGFEITFKDPHKNPDNCSNTQVVDLACSDTPQFKSMVSMALTGFTAGKSVDVWLNGCDSEGNAKVMSLVLKP
ncbi:hypothetical protein [Microbulbifer sp. ZKSA002]|uniref:hypothetical protein n=1 Tax=Microbulbifer sp. ZKSA002 TaxID=3243388 RepID=UPI00403A0D25